MDRKNRAKITKDMGLAEITQKFPETMEVMMKHGLFCFGCPHASAETLEQGAAGHGIDLEVLLKELNAAVESGGPSQGGSSQGETSPEAGTQDSGQSAPAP